MSVPLLLPMPGNEGLCERLARPLDAEVGAIEVRRFPDGESYVRYRTSPKGRQSVLCCTLDGPDEKFLPLIFAAETARDLGARSVGLVSPYLSYMRQDRRFKEGEAVTSAQFARLLSRAVDWLVTIDPHLHRYGKLAEIYSVPTAVLHAAPLISRWIATEVRQPLLIGPDSESAQWVGLVAEEANAPCVVLQKIRLGDSDVRVSVPEVEKWRDHSPVLVDDIVSTAHTMIETARHLREAGMKPPVCVAIHAVFAGDSFRELCDSAVGRIVTANTIFHPSNGIDVTPLLAEALRQQMR